MGTEFGWTKTKPKKVVHKLGAGTEMDAGIRGTIFTEGKKGRNG